MSTATLHLAEPGRHQLSPSVYGYELEGLRWQTTPRGTAREIAVRRDNEAGHFLGLITLDPMSRSGVHQHLGTATSYFLAGSLTDHQATTREGSVGVNLAGATHDAVTYTGATLVSRLEGRVIVPEGGLAIHPHAGQASVRNARPETPPDITIELERAVPVATRFGGVGRRPLFDYAGTGDDRRMCALTIWPRTPRFVIRHSALTDIFVMAGDLRIGSKSVSGPAFVVIEPDATVEMGSEFGCSLLAWAEGPAHGADSGEGELYGFN